MSIERVLQPPVCPSPRSRVKTRTTSSGVSRDVAAVEKCVEFLAEREHFMQMVAAQAQVVLDVREIEQGLGVFPLDRAARLPGHTDLC